MDTEVYSKSENALEMFQVNPTELASPRLKPSLISSVMCGGETRLPSVRSFQQPGKLCLFKTLDATKFWRGRAFPSPTAANTIEDGKFEPIEENHAALWRSHSPDELY
ncbi:MAG: hypothetical protein ABR905_19830 [Terracidiphilus sp.]|jgi:hypothetical protein